MRVVAVADEFQQVGADGVAAIVAGQGRVGLGGGSFVQAGAWPVHHGDGDDAVQCDDGAGRGDVQQVVEGEDLRPVGVFGSGRVVVHGGDRRLQTVGAGAGGGGGERPGDQRGALGYGGGIPAAAVLFGEWYQGAVRVGPGRSAGVG